MACNNRKRFNSKRRAEYLKHAVMKRQLLHSTSPSSSTSCTSSSSQSSTSNRSFIKKVVNYYFAGQQPGIYSGSIDVSSMISVPHGHGKIHYLDGSTYEGAWFDGRWSGFGTFWDSKKKVKYQGSFLDGKKNGLFVITYNDGRVYDGEFQMEVMGKGVMTYPSVGKYWGYFDGQERPHGRGKFMFADGTTYDGEFDHGTMEGHGRMTYKNTDEYTYFIGYFSGGRRFGHGVLMVDEHIVHDGTWDNDKPIIPSSVPVSSRASLQKHHLHHRRLLGRIPKDLTPCSRLKHGSRAFRSYVQSLEQQ